MVDSGEGKLYFLHQIIFGRGTFEMKSHIVVVNIHKSVQNEIT